MVEAANPSGLVSILIVTFNSAKRLPACLAALQQQDYHPLEVLIVDNASTDGTRDLLAPLAARHAVTLNSENRGFAAGQNQAIRQAKGEWLLCLNPDVLLGASFISELVSSGALDPSVGTVCGKLLRWNPAESPEKTKIIDSTGIYFLPNLRHLDRGADIPDTGQYEQAEYVFGATGAAALYRRQMVDDVSVAGEFYDEAFFSYREDADLAWRAQLMDWKCLYTPQAVAWHERRVTPERFHSLPFEINWHSVKNRFLMRAKNASPWLGLRFLFPILWRDALIFGYAFLRDWRLLSALWYPLAHLRSVREKRQWVQSRRRVSDRVLGRWFSWTPMSEPFQTDTSQAARSR